MITRDLTVTFTCDRCGVTASAESELLPLGWSTLSVQTTLGTKTYQLGPECLQGLDGRTPLLGWWKVWAGPGGNPSGPPKLPPLTAPAP